MSEGSITLRMQVANAAAAVSAASRRSRRKRVSFTVAGFLASRVDQTSVDEFLAECEGMTKRQAEEHLIALRPKPFFQPDPSSEIKTGEGPKS